VQHPVRSSIAQVSVIRSHLYVPADQPRLLARAETRGADAIIIDLEDSVAPARKPDALAATLDFLKSGRVSSSRWVRVNQGSLGLSEIRELRKVTGLEGVWLPKIEPGEWASQAIALLAETGTRVGLLIESAAGLVGMPQLPAVPANTLAQLGEVDLAADLRMRDTSDEAMVPYRARIVMECVIRGMAAPVAPVAIRLDDRVALRVSTTSLRDRGFGSRACIHPAQVEIVNTVFAIDDADRNRAREIIDQFDANASAGTGVFVGEEGEMVDAATVRWARAVLDEGSGS
jgi:citrate lyase beta subunit